MGKSSGLKRRTRGDGTVVFYWVASAASPDPRGYPIKTMRLYTTSEDEASAQCGALTAELNVWLASQAPVAAPDFAGTLAGLVDCYQRDEESPYRDVKENTRRHYDQVLAIIRDQWGDAPVTLLSRKDFSRWYRTAREPVEIRDGDGKAAAGPERVRRAHNCMKLVRIIVNYGASMRYDGCAEVASVLSQMRFELPAPRRSQLSYAQAEAVISGALKAGRPSVALAQALQFELSLRQKDVVGEWTTAREGEAGIVYFGKRWSNGVLWSDLSPDLVLTKQTTKTAVIGEWNLSLHPLVMQALAAFPADKRVGPMIISETTGHPYRPDDFRVKWRELARAAGVPDDVWNMDSRAGGISEGDEAGADINDLRKHATHADAKMTGRYIRTGTLKATEKVARLRTANREQKKS